MTSKLDPVTAREWQEQKPKNELATLEEFKLFIKSKNLAWDLGSNFQRVKVK